MRVQGTSFSVVFKLCSEVFSCTIPQRAKLTSCSARGLGRGQSVPPSVVVLLSPSRPLNCFWAFRHLVALDVAPPCI